MYNERAGYRAVLSFSMKFYRMIFGLQMSRKNRDNALIVS
ncbi:hypothetical protein RV11_GL001327 [Enterococcus phoeniculicola]|nr:hypothetical protein RV11_GL001327 [Enterococcus phoeniculicola]